MPLKVLGGNPLDNIAERDDRAGSDPFITVPRDDLCGSFVVLGIKQKWQSTLPLPVFQIDVRDPVSFEVDTRLADLRSQASLQKITKQWVEPVFLGRAAIASGSEKNILLCQERERRRAAQIRKQHAALF